MYREFKKINFVHCCVQLLYLLLSLSLGCAWEETGAHMVTASLLKKDDKCATEQVKKLVPTLDLPYSTLVPALSYDCLNLLRIQLLLSTKEPRSVSLVSIREEATVLASHLWQVIISQYCNSVNVY